MRTTQRLSTLAFALLAGLASSAHAAPVIDLGAAAGYSAFIFGDVKAANDIEGRLAVGGNLSANGASFGYRAPNSDVPAIVVGGDIKLSNGRIYSAAPASVADTTAGAGNQPVWDPTLKHYGQGYAVYGGSKTGSSSYLNLTHVEKVSTVVDFAAAQTQLTKLSTELGQTDATGSTVRQWSELVLTGSGKDDATEIFNLTLDKAANAKSFVLPSLKLKNVDADAWVVVNILNAGDVELSGGFTGFKDIQESFGRVIFNLPNATSVKLGWVDGSVLAPKADLKGQGHVEGTVIGKSISQAFEIGWEPPVPNKTNKVPEPASLALVLAGLLGAGFTARRKARA